MKIRLRKLEVIVLSRRKSRRKKSWEEAVMNWKKCYKLKEK